MAAPPLQRIFKKRLTRLQQLLANPKQMTQGEERLHRLRVELKKWRAGLRLLKKVDPAFPYPEIYKPFKTLFAAAGQLRFWQLQLQLVNRSALLPSAFARPYRSYLRSRLREAWKNLRKTAGKNGLPAWRDLKEEFRQSCEACTPAATRAYFEAMAQGIAVKTRTPARRRAAELHELRKLLKEYANNRQLASKYLHFDPGPPGGIPAGNANFDELLGQWHDQDAACIQLAEDLRTQGWEAEALRAGKKVLRDWKRTERKMWEEVAGALVKQH